MILYKKADADGAKLVEYPDAYFASDKDAWRSMTDFVLTIEERQSFGERVDNKQSHSQQQKQNMLLYLQHVRKGYG